MVEKYYLLNFSTMVDLSKIVDRAHGSKNNASYYMNLTINFPAPSLLYIMFVVLKEVAINLFVVIVVHVVIASYLLLVAVLDHRCNANDMKL